MNRLQPTRLALLLLGATAAACLADATVAPPSATVPAPLRGTELLAELVKVAPSMEQPGVYTWTPADGWKRLVAHAFRPRWSPRHDQVVYWCGGQLWRLRTGQTKAETVWLGTPVVDDTAEWMPDGSGWYVKGLSSLGAADAGSSSTTLLRVRDLPATAALPLALPPWRRAAAEWMGRWSTFDGKRFAYENRREVPGLGLVACEVRLADLDGTTFETLALPGLPDAILFNPQWQPGGRLLALEAVDRTGRRRTALLYDSATKELRRIGRNGIEPCTGLVDGPESALLRWQPDGRALLAVLGGQIDAVPAVAGPALVSLEPGRTPKSIGAPAGRVVAHAVSADSRQVAVAVSNWVTPRVNPHMRLTLRSVDADGTVTCRFVDLPDGLQIADLDW